MTSLRNRLSAGELLILDGAIGTELERRGVPSTGDAAWAQALATDPDLVYAVHADYLRAGANVITTNTYSNGAHVLEKIGRLDEFERWNKLAVDLARQARALITRARLMFTLRVRSRALVTAQCAIPRSTVPLPGGKTRRS